MKKRLYLLAIFLILVLTLTSCKRDSFTIPEFTSPSTLDYYIVLNVSKTVLNPGENTPVQAKVIGPNGEPVVDRYVKFRLELNGSSTHASLYAYLSSNSVKTDGGGIARTVLYTFPQMIYSGVPITVYAWTGTDPVNYSNRTIVAQTTVYIIPNF